MKHKTLITILISNNSYYTLGGGHTCIPNSEDQQPHLHPQVGERGAHLHPEFGRAATTPAALGRPAATPGVRRSGEQRPHLRL